MKLAAAIAFALTLSTAVHAQQGLPSERVLADMGLTGIRVLSDHEALAVRGHGFADVLAGYRLGITTAHQAFNHQQETAPNHPSQAEPWYIRDLGAFKHRIGG